LTKQNENPPEGAEPPTLARETTWTISCYTNQLVSQLTYLNSKSLDDNCPKHAQEMISLVRQYKKRLKQLVNKEYG